MKAVVYRAEQPTVQLDDVEVPVPANDQVLVRVGACGICGSDIHGVANGTMQPGHVLGHEYAGEIVALGHGVQHLNVGERVFCLPTFSCGGCDECKQGRTEYCAHAPTVGGFKIPGATSSGGYAEFCLAGARAVVRIPDHLSYAEAALTEPLATGFKATRRAAVHPGDSVLVVGAGPIGLSCALWSYFRGARDVIVSERSERRLQLARALGATATINALHSPDPVEAFTQMAGRAPTVIIEAVGSRGLIAQLVAQSARDARLVVVGLLEGPDQFEPSMALVKDMQLIFSNAYSLSDCETIIEMIGNGRVDPRPMLTRSVTINEVPDLLHSLRTNKDEGKVMMCH